MIDSQSLFHVVHDKVVLLMELDPARATALLVLHAQDLPVPDVIAQLQTHPEWLYTCVRAW